MRRHELNRFAWLSDFLPPWLSFTRTRLDDMIDMDVWLTGGVGLTNGGRGWP
jgi:hypothetical protein